MPLSERENYLRTMGRLEGAPQWIPASVYVNEASRDLWRLEIEQVMARHPLFFPGFEPGERDYDNHDYGPGRRRGERFRDSFGCVWLTDISGFEGQVVERPLGDWADLDAWPVPDPVTTLDREPADWVGARARAEQARARGALALGGAPHGFFFMRLWYLRGFENLMLDIAAAAPELGRLIQKLDWHNLRLIGQWLDIGVDQVNFGEDLGTQTASFISPTAFAKWVTPSYKRYFKPVRDAGALVFLHSDGYIMDLVDEFCAAGVDIINPQDRCNGIDALAEAVKGRMNIRIDVDRQHALPFGSRGDIFDLIEEEVRKLGSARGGLAITAGIYPPTPPENLDALCRAIEKYRTWWWDGRG